MRNSISILLAFLFSISAGIAAADSHNEVLLTFTNGNEIVEYDLEALEAMESVTFETSTIWSEGPQVFTGVSLHTFVAELQIDEGVLLASAINDYTVEIPTSDAVTGGPIIAYLRNGSSMSVRDKGPLWVVYPYDSKAEYQSETIYSRSIWQLDRIALKQ